MAPRSFNYGYQPVTSRIIRRDKYWNVFNYSADSTVYFLNDEHVKSQGKARKELDERSAGIERVPIGAVDSKWQRRVEINYQVKSKN